MNLHERDPRDPIRTPPEETWLQRGIVVAILLGCAVAVSPSVAEPDLWGHVQYGRDVLADMRLPESTTYSFTADGYRWINHENLAELVFAIGANLTGAPGLLIFKCLLSLLLFGIMLVHARRKGVGLTVTAAVLLLVAVNIAYHWSVRPQLFTYTFYGLLLALLAYCFSGWEGEWRVPLLMVKVEEVSRPALSYSPRRLRYLWLAVPLFAVWTNSHGGFVAGYCIFAAYLVCRSIEAVACRGRAAAGLVARFAMMTIAAGLATFLNPYGPTLHTWLAHDLGMPRPEIIEWWPPDLFASNAIVLWVLMGVWAAALLLTRRSRDFTHMVVMALTLWQALEHQRHIPFFAIAFGFWMPVHVQSALSRMSMFRAEGASEHRALPTPARLLLAAALGGVFVLLAGRLYQRVHEMPVHRSEFPVSAFQYMEDHGLRGKMLVTFNWAQYAIAAFGQSEGDRPTSLVQFDGRCRTSYPQEIADIHFDFVLGDAIPGGRFRSPNSPEPDPALALEFGEPELVLISRHHPHSVFVMNQHRDSWALLYQDELAQLWGRKSVYDDPASDRYLPLGARTITDEPQVGSVAWPALPQRRLTLDRESNVAGADTVKGDES
jgi:hypothetical protein